MGMASLHSYTDADVTPLGTTPSGAFTNIASTMPHEAETSDEIVRSGNMARIMSAIATHEVRWTKLYDGRNLLHRLCSYEGPLHDRLRIINLLLTWPWIGSDIDGTNVLDALDSSGFTPLMIVIDRLGRKGSTNTELIRLLLDRGARPKAFGRDGLTARALALHYNMTEAAQMLQESEEEWGDEQYLYKECFFRSSQLLWLELRARRMEARGEVAEVDEGLDTERIQALSKDPETDRELWSLLERYVYEPDGEGSSEVSSDSRSSLYI